MTSEGQDDEFDEAELEKRIRRALAEARLIALTVEDDRVPWGFGRWKDDR